MFGLGGLFGGTRAAAPDLRDAGDDRWFMVGGQQSEIGITVTVDRARQVPVVRDCLKVLADSVAGLSIGVFRREGDGQKARVDGHPVERVLRNPNERTTGFELMYALVDDIAGPGDFFAEIVRESGELVQLRRLPPETVTVEEAYDGSRRFRVQPRQGPQRVLVEGEVWHVPMPPVAAMGRGRSPILDDGREAVAVAIALQQYANRFFTNDATPPFVLSMDSAFRDQASKENFLRAWRKWFGGRNRGTPAVLEHGMTASRLGLSAEESQFIETRKELWLDLTRLWRVPPHKVGIMDRATFSNIEHQSLEFVIDTLRPILELVEASVSKYLIEDPDLFLEFDVTSLLRGDIKARYDAYAMGRQWGWLSVNDILRMEGRNPIGPAGDRYIEPLNMVPAGSGTAERNPDRRQAVESAVAFLHESVAPRAARPKLKVVRDAA